MSGMASVIEPLLLAAVAGGKSGMPRRNKADWAVTALSILLAAGGGGFLVLALDRYLESVYPPTAAALLCAGALFASALAAFGLTQCCRVRRMPPVDSAHNALVTNITALLEGALAELEAPVQESPKTALLLAAVAGFFVARQASAR